jgi:hypothetical protein
MLMAMSEIVEDRLLELLRPQTSGANVIQVEYVALDTVATFLRLARFIVHRHALAAIPMDVKKEQR